MAVWAEVLIAMAADYAVVGTIFLGMIAGCESANKQVQRICYLLLCNELSPYDDLIGS